MNASLRSTLLAVMSCGLLSPTASAAASTGSEGATAFVQTNAGGGALQGEVAPTANTTIKLPFGVLGEYDAATSRFGIGVAGISTSGYAVGAEALGKNAAILAENAGTGDAIDALGSASSALAAYSSTQFEAFGGSSQFPTSGDSTAAGATLSVATNNQVGDIADTYVEYGGKYYPTLTLTSKPLRNLGIASDLILRGDIYLTGTVFTECQGYSVPLCIASADGSASQRTDRGGLVQTYAAHEASPSLEDTGEARLVDGYAHVAVDPAFASTISNASPYLVFTSPQGDCNGLYVTHRTPAGFDVRELRGGRSSLAFDYRIVAKPYGDAAVRLAALAPRGRMSGRVREARQFPDLLGKRP